MYETATRKQLPFILRSWIVIWVCGCFCFVLFCVSCLVLAGGRVAVVFPRDTETHGYERGKGEVEGRKVRQERHVRLLQLLQQLDVLSSVFDKHFGLGLRLQVLDVVLLPLYLLCPTLRPTHAYVIKKSSNLWLCVVFCSSWGVLCSLQQLRDSTTSLWKRDSVHGTCGSRAKA
ncbi:LAFA_0D06766g1_1 [Lachancea sp. 'fantastica']|nr:LAFA_0D06766g1_1 [Lachancea sp. 'fantastica']